MKTNKMSNVELKFLIKNKKMSKNRFFSAKFVEKLLV